MSHRLHRGNGDRAVVVEGKSCTDSSSIGDASAATPRYGIPSADITAVAVTYNSARHLAALGRALASATLVPTRMLVVDNASSDDSVDRARTAGFDVLEMESNQGFGAGCNAGLNASSSEFVLFCNPDVEPSPNALKRLFDALRTTPTAAIAGASLRHPVEARRFSRLPDNLWYFIPAPLKHRLNRFKPTLTVDVSMTHVVVDFAEGAFILCRSAALRSVRGFDESFFLYSEEEDLARRLGARGWQTILAPSATVGHGHSESSDGVGKPLMEPFRLHSLYWYYRRYHPRLYAELARDTLAICVLIDRAYRALTGKDQLYCAGAAIAAFRSTDALKLAHLRRVSAT
jgi:N-acetylglucosaminyl-diphospho-decaprenol L-rhamnosyltransferase